MNPEITRRGFVKAGGALFVSIGVAPKLSWAAWDAVAPSDLVTGPADPTKLASWLEIREDNTVLVRTGRTEIGVGMSGYYAQTVAEELRVQPDAISLVMGDTDKTPDGGYSAGLLDGAKNLRKVSAYTYQALLTLASTQLGVPATGLSVTDGVVSGGGGGVVSGPVTASKRRCSSSADNSLRTTDWIGRT